MEILKGQFMLISAIIIGLMIIATGAVVSQIQSESVEPDNSALYSTMIKHEARKVNISDPKERQNFIKMVGMLDSYSTDAVFWDSQNCFNVTMVKPGSRVELDCIG